MDQRDGGSGKRNGVLDGFWGSPGGELGWGAHSLEEMGLGFSLAKGGMKAC